MPPGAAADVLAAINAAQGQLPGQIIAISQAADNISFPAMERKMEAAIAIIQRDPAVPSIASQIILLDILTLKTWQLRADVAGGGGGSTGDAIPVLLLVDGNYGHHHCYC